MKSEWDSEKERINIQKHGITFEQASYIFADPFALNKYDDEHSYEDEDRWLLLEVSKMKDEYDFTGAEQGKFYRPIEELDIPIYLDKEIKDFFVQRIRKRGQQFSLSQVVNSLLKKDIEILEQLTN